MTHFILVYRLNIFITQNDMIKNNEKKKPKMQNSPNNFPEIFYNFFSYLRSNTKKSIELRRVILLDNESFILLSKNQFFFYFFEWNFNHLSYKSRVGWDPKNQLYFLLLNNLLDWVMTMARLSFLFLSKPRNPMWIVRLKENKKL